MREHGELKHVGQLRAWLDKLKANKKGAESDDTHSTAERPEAAQRRGNTVFVRASCILQ